MNEWDEGHEEDSSFISMADMMVGLLLIFIILLTYYVLTSQRTIERAEQISKTEQAMEVTRRIVLNRIKERVDNDEVQFDDKTGTIRFSEDVVAFVTDEHKLSEDAEIVLGKVAIAMAETLPCMAYLESSESIDCAWLDEEFERQEFFDRNLGSITSFRPPDGVPLIWVDGVFIEGHTDCKPAKDDYATDIYNWILGSKRAATTYLFLTRYKKILGFNLAEKPGESRTAGETLGSIFSKNPDDPRTAGDAHRILGIASFADRRPAGDPEFNNYPDDPRLFTDWIDHCSKLPKATNDRNRRIDIRIVMGWTAQILAPS